MPEITTITSESLQAEVRRLLPSQRGFGQDLEAQNVIVPIVDLTPTAEGSALREDLQRAASVGSVTSTEQLNAGSNTVIATPGFWAYNFTLHFNTFGTPTGARRVNINLTDGTSTRRLHRLLSLDDGTGEDPVTISGHGTVFLKTGDSVVLENSGADTYSQIAIWQIADVNGNLVNPSGFSFE